MHKQMKKIDPLKVRERIRDLELKQYWVAEEAGVHKTTLRRWLNGRISRVKPRNVERLAFVLSTDAPSLIDH